MALMALDQTLIKIMYRASVTTLRCRDNGVTFAPIARSFWKRAGQEKELEEQRKNEEEKKRRLEERQKQLQARGLPKKRPIPG